LVLLLPGSREGEVRRHLPVMLEATKRIGAATPAQFQVVLPNEGLTARARELAGGNGLVRFQSGALDAALAQATVAIASTGTVTLECALAGVPTVALYKTSPLTYALGRRIVKVKWLSMPNLLAGEAVFPEFIQDAATAGNLADATLQFLRDEERRRATEVKLRQIAASLGEPGASRRAAEAILRMPG
jgi:lipid-A-disaccharide synthase